METNFLFGVSPQTLAMAGAVAFFAAGLVVWSLASAVRSGGGVAKSFSVSGIETRCPTCQTDMWIPIEGMAGLSPVETGLAVSANPSLAGKKLVDAACKNCGAVLCFSVGPRGVEPAGANLYVPEESTARCQECRKLLKSVPLPQAALELGVKISADPDVGLVCSRCEAHCCFACIASFTRNRTTDGSLLCPRCARGPVNRVFQG